jgi:cbb3-type cytochrome oxidase maturation protein
MASTKTTTPMSALIILLLVSIGIAGSFLVAYLWSVRDGQFDDDYSPARRILFPDQPPGATNSTANTITDKKTTT